MPRPSPLSASAVLLLAAALSACDPAKPPDTPEGAGQAPSKEKAEDGDSPKDKDTPAAPAGGEEPSGGEVGGQAGAAAPKVDKSLSLDTYEMMPSDCNALGAQYGQVARSDQMSALSPKLTEKQRAGTVAQIDKVVGKNEETWTNGCHTSLVNKAVDHDAIKCALAAKSVKDFDTCINGVAGTPQPSGKKKK